MLDRYAAPGDGHTALASNGRSVFAAHGTARDQRLADAHQAALEIETHHQ